MAISAVQRASIFGPVVRHSNGGQGTAPANLRLITTPWGIRVQVHHLIVPVFLDACVEAAARPWTPRRIDSFNPRTIRGSSALSLHALGLAVDFFHTPPDVPPPGGVWTPHDGMPEDFAACFERRGFTWGGRWTSRRDVPHIEWAAGRPPTSPVPTPAPIAPLEDDMPPELWMIPGDDTIWLVDRMMTRRAVRSETELTQIQAALRNRGYNGDVINLRAAQRPLLEGIRVVR